MCGINGIVGPRASPERMRAMRDRIAHRGPDSAGEYLDDHAALGVRRLRIIDIAHGDQPIANETRTVWTVFNGEIYNYRELRRELEAAGHRFATASDTEVVVHLYESHGERFVERLDGMFALAVWDARERRLILARDRFGKKPLLYRVDGDELAFASEHQALLGAAEAAPVVDPLAIGAYLRLGYVPSPLDAFVGIRKLRPGEQLTWQNGQIVLHRYWQVPALGTLRIAEEEAVERIRVLLRAAVEKRLMSDVPLGAFLSGGLDSSAVVATMASLGPRVKTFSIGFAEADYSELTHARRIATAFDTDHHELVVDPLQADVLPMLARHYGEPYADSSALPTYLLSRLTRADVTVALNGDGGDEVFAGYDRYVALRLAALADRIPGGPQVAGLVSRLLPLGPSLRGKRGRIGRFLRGAARSGRDRYLAWTELFDAPALADIVESAFAARAAGGLADALAERPAWSQGDPVSSAQALDLTLYLPDDLLAKVDIASMAASLEVRSPLLDRALAEFVLSLPTSLRLGGGERKHLMRRAMNGVLPAGIISRAKQGFGIPVSAWFRDPLRELVGDTVLSQRALDRGYFRPERVRALYEDHRAGRADHGARLWSLLMLELWHRELVDNRPL
ncbi:MAG: asparagine synthase (glutamine-hydrolyzing) [Chloroflexi bacterium]|nr:asparagine synthase (glutamine-hydrolyzing) [Chloroflexota bacterium]